jgi:hypothetical protein
MKYDDIVLETEQKKLLSALVEASRSVPRDKRRKFLLRLPVGHSSSILDYPVAIPLMLTKVM